MAPNSESSHYKNTLEGTPDPAAAFLDRWHQQMSTFFPERALLVQRAAEYVIGRLHPAQPGTNSLRVAVLGSGPGLLANDVLTNLTHAGLDVEMTAVERDPAIANLGRDAYGAKINFTTLDLAATSWEPELPAKNFDVVLSAYTTHYFQAEALAGVYRNVATLLADGGVFVNVDFMSTEPQPEAALLPSADADRGNSHHDARENDDVQLTPSADLAGDVADKTDQEPAPVGDWDELVADIQSHPRYLVEGNPYANAGAHDDGDLTLEDHKKLLSAAGLSSIDILHKQGASAVLVATRI